MKRRRRIHPEGLAKTIGSSSYTSSDDYASSKGSSSASDQDFIAAGEANQAEVGDKSTRSPFSSMLGSETRSEDVNSKGVRPSVTSAIGKNIPGQGKRS